MENGTKRYLNTIEWLGKLYDYMNDQLFNSELVRPVITVQVDDKNRAYGWFTLKRIWQESNVANRNPTLGNPCDGCPMEDTCNREMRLMPVQESKKLRIVP